MEEFLAYVHSCNFIYLNILSLSIKYYSKLMTHEVYWTNNRKLNFKNFNMFIIYLWLIPTALSGKLFLHYCMYIYKMGSTFIYLLAKCCV